MALNFKSLWSQLSGLTAQEKELIDQFEKEPKATTMVASSDILRKRGYIDEAIVLLEDAVKRFPNYIAAHVSLGRDYYSRGLFTEAQREIEFALSHSVENLMAQRIQLKLALLNNDKEKVYASVEVLRALTPMDDFTRTTKEYIDLGDLVSAKNVVLADLRRYGITLPESMQSGSQHEATVQPPSPAQFVNSLSPQSPMGTPVQLVAKENTSATKSAEWKIPSKHNETSKDSFERPAVGSDGLLDFGHGGVSIQPALLDNSGIFADLPPWINEQLLPPAFTPGASLAHVRGDLDRYLQLRVFRLITSPEAFSRRRALQQAYSLESTTLADIYAGQGHFERAIAIYERLLKDNPTQTSLKHRLEKLQEEARQAASERYGVQQNSNKPQTPVQAASHAERERKLKFLEALLKKMDERVDAQVPQGPNALKTDAQTSGNET